jgi:hypothetical protein
MLDKTVGFGGFDLQLASILEGKDHRDFTPLKRDVLSPSHKRCDDLSIGFAHDRISDTIGA